MSSTPPNFGPPQYQPYYPQPPQQAPAKSNGPMIAVSIIAILLAVALVGFLAFYFGSNQSNRSNPVNSAQSSNTVNAQQEQQRPTVTQTVNAPAPEADQPKPAPKRTYTDWSVNDSEVTTAPFAANVFSDFVAAYNKSGNPNLTLNDVYSPTTGKYYTMTCRDQGSHVACTGGRNAAVYIK